MILNTIATGAGRPVVLLHGLFGSAQSLGTLARHVAKTHRVLAIDLRNHGASPHADGMDYVTMAADVAETLAREQVGSCAVVGHSMGGKVAMRLALDAPELVARLLVSDVAPVVYADHGNIRLAKALAGLPLTADLTRSGADAALAPLVPDQAVRSFLLQNLRFGPPRWRIGLAEIATGMPDIEGWPATGATYPGPALFVAGARSDYILPAYRTPIRGLFPSARFVQVKDAGHWVHADNLAGFLAVLDAFLTPY